MFMRLIPFLFYSLLEIPIDLNFKELSKLKIPIGNSMKKINFLNFEKLTKFCILLISDLKLVLKLLVLKTL